MAEGFANPSTDPLTPGAKLDIRISDPRLFTLPTLIVLNLFGVILLVPALAAFFAVSFMKLSWLTFGIPLFTLLATLVFLPFGFGNAYVARLARRLPATPGDGATFLVQLTCEPRIHSGPRSLLEDADDFGILTVAKAGLIFTGDSVQCSVPWSAVQHLQRHNIGWRGAFLYGSPVMVVPESRERVFSFAERSSWTLPGSRRRSRELYEALEKARAAAAQG